MEKNLNSVAPWMEILLQDVPLEIVDSGDHFPRTQSRPLLRDAFMLALVGAFSLLNPRIPRLGTCY